MSPHTHVITLKVPRREMNQGDLGVWLAQSPGPARLLLDLSEARQGLCSLSLSCWSKLRTLPSAPSAPRASRKPLFAHSCIHSLNLLAGTCLLSTYCAPGNTTVKAGWWGRHTCAACWDAHRVRQVREPQGKKEIREGFLEAEKA